MNLLHISVFELSPKPKCQILNRVRDSINDSTVCLFKEKLMTQKSTVLFYCYLRTQFGEWSQIP